VTDARRKAVERWYRSDKGKAAARRYRETAKGKAAAKRANEKRITVATRVIYLPTKDTRDLAYALIQRRRREFVTRQSADSGMETDSPDAVQA
jgi:hypothetical protein